MKISGIKSIRPVFFVTLVIFFFASCNCYMKTDLGDESIDVSITRKKDAAENTGIILSFNKVSSVLDIPAELQGMPVVKVLFADATNMSSLESIVIPDSVTEIDTFEKASSLKAVNLPDNLAYMPSFKECSNLSEIAIPAGVTEIPESCFEGCKKLTKIYKKSSGSSGSTSEGNQETNLTDSLEGIKIIGKRAFYNCSALSSIALETTEITALEELTFYGCSSLSTIKLPSTIETIGAEVFNNCSALTTVENFNLIAPLEDDKIKPLGDKIFYSCTKLNKITINSQLKEIPKNMFNGCTSLKSFTIPEKIEKIGGSAFAGSALNELFCYPVEPPAIEASSLPELKPKAESEELFTLYLPAESIEAYKDAWAKNIDWSLVDVKTIGE